MVRKRKKHAKEIDWEKILPPRTKIEGVTRVAELEHAERLSERMREMQMYSKPPILKEKNFNY